jgi:hypothetical protein
MGNGREGFGKRNEQVEKIGDNKSDFGGLIFLHNTKPSSFRELKNCIEEVF